MKVGGILSWLEDHCVDVHAWEGLESFMQGWAWAEGVSERRGAITRLVVGTRPVILN